MIEWNGWFWLFISGFAVFVLLMVIGFFAIKQEEKDNNKRKTTMMNKYEKVLTMLWKELFKVIAEKCNVKLDYYHRYDGYLQLKVYFDTVNYAVINVYSSIDTDVSWYIKDVELFNKEKALDVVKDITEIMNNVKGNK